MMVIIGVPPYPARYFSRSWKFDNKRRREDFCRRINLICFVLYNQRGTSSINRSYFMRFG